MYHRHKLLVLKTGVLHSKHWMARGLTQMGSHNRLNVIMLYNYMDKPSASYSALIPPWFCSPGIGIEYRGKCIFIEGETSNHLHVQIHNMKFPELNTDCTISSVCLSALLTAQFLWTPMD
jgi:hypothetical protein